MKCDFNNYVCSATNAVPLANPQPDTVYDTCKSKGITEHLFTICGPTQINLANYDREYNFKPNIATPKDTLCKYDFSYNQPFSDTFSFAHSANEQLTIKQTKNGVVTTVDPSRRRNLQGIKRGLTTSSYVLSNVDSFSVYYVSTTDQTSTSFVVTSLNSYSTSQTNINPVTGGGTGGSTVTGTATISSDGDSNTGIVIAVALTIIFVGIIVTILCLCWYKRKSSSGENRVHVRENNHVQFDGVIQEIDVVPYDVIRRLEQMKEVRYSKAVDAYNTENCVICLDDFMDNDRVRIIHKK